LGLKESVIVGRLIPAGTGAVMNRIKRIAAARDRDLLELKEQAALAAAAAAEAEAAKELAEQSLESEQTPVA
jgi:DNA-directed RNA polymerase subunit beta'